MLAYAREDDKEEIIVLNNFYGKSTTVTLTEDLAGFEPLISNYAPRQLASHMELAPYESAAWIRKK